MFVLLTLSFVFSVFCAVKLLRNRPCRRRAPASGCPRMRQGT